MSDEKSAGEEIEIILDDESEPLDPDPKVLREQHGFWVGRSALVMPAIVAALGVFLVIGIADMEVVDEEELFGPKAFPELVAALCFIIAILLTISILRNPEVPQSMISEEGDLLPGTASNWTATAITVGSLLLFAVILEPIGWIVSAAIVFWGVSIGLGSKRYLFNLLVGLAMSSILQLVFSGLLDLSLPAGIMG